MYLQTVPKSNILLYYTEYNTITNNHYNIAKVQSAGKCYFK